MYENTNLHHFGPEQIAASRRAYYACITQVDYALGRLLGCLRENGLFENTWIVFTSDHGEMLGDHHMSQKNLFFEGSAHVPLLIVPPAGRGCSIHCTQDTLAEMADLLPTLLDMAGLPAPAHTHGKSLLRPMEERVFYGNSLNKHFCVMDKNLKLIYCAAGGCTLLFDVAADPQEERDLSNDAAWAAEKERLWAMLLRHTAAYSPSAMENGAMRKTPAPRSFGDIKGRWFGFHYRDYSVDTFH